MFQLANYFILAGHLLGFRDCFIYFYVWIQENIKKKNGKENDFFIFGLLVENLKENHI